MMEEKSRFLILRKLSLPVKVLFSCFLITIGSGYLFAVLYLYLMEVEPHAKEGKGIVQAVILKYYGNRGGTRLQAALDGAMSENVTPAEKGKIIRWIGGGATEAGFAAVQSIFTDNCVSCHNKEGGLPSLATFQEVSAYTALDMGQSVKTLVRVSHIHLFGMSFIFMLTSGIFALSEVRPSWRAILIAIPFVAIWLDIGSWWFTKMQPLFAYTVIVGGLLMGLSLALQIFLSFYELWLKRERPS